MPSPVPTPPTVPLPALRSDQATFRDRAEANVSFFAALVDYMSAFSDWTEATALEVFLTALAGDLPALTGQAGKLLQVNQTGDGLQAFDDPFLGMSFAFNGGVIPDGFLFENGALVPEVSYPALFSKIGNTWGPSVGGSFPIPDSRARHIEGATQTDEVGDYLAQSVESHLHSADPDPFTTASGGSHFHQYLRETTNATTSVGVVNPVSKVTGKQGNTVTNTQGSEFSNHAHLIDVPAFLTGATGGTHTRPASNVKLICIKH